METRRTDKDNIFGMPSLVRAAWGALPAGCLLSVILSVDAARGDDALTGTQHLLVQAFSSVQVWLEKITPQPTDAAENIWGHGQAPPPPLGPPPPPQGWKKKRTRSFVAP